MSFSRIRERVQAWGQGTAKTTALHFKKIEHYQQVQQLASQMQIPLHAMLLIRTQDPKKLGANYLGSGRIAITDSLFAALDWDELMAVISHELAHHHHRGETLRMILSCFGLSALCGLASLYVLLSPAVALMVTLLGLLISFRAVVQLKQAHEKEADAAAVHFVGTEALLGALAKVYSVQGNDLTKPSLKHGSALERLMRVTQHANLSLSELGVALEHAKKELLAKSLPLINVPTKNDSGIQDLLMNQVAPAR